MKTSIRLSSLAGLWVAVCAVVLGADTLHAGSQPKTKNASAEVQKVTGTASYQVGDGPVVQIKPGTTIPAGAVVTTGAGSSIDVFLGRNTGVIRLGEESSLRIQTLKVTRTGSDVVTETHLQLEKGQISGFVNKQTEGSEYQITLPDGVMNVKKSEFQVSNQGVNALNDSPGGRSVPDAPQTTIRIISGQAEFSQAGTTHSFDGPSEFNPGSGSSGVVPLAPDAAKEFSLVIPGSDKKGSESGQKENGQTQGQGQGQGFASVPPPTTPVLQEVPVISPTEGQNN